MATIDKAKTILPGLMLCVAVTVLAYGVEYAERILAGTVWIDGLVVAIVLGTIIHSLRRLDHRILPGVQFSSKTLLEIAIVLLGATISLASLQEAGFRMMGMVALAVFMSLVVSYTVGRLLGLSDRLATLVACGNSICGNSAIVAAAPVIEAGAEDVASSIAFTAALGILVVLLLPLIQHLFGLGQWQYGVVAGMVVYAVPQVMAATVPVGIVSTQIGALVKLMRVLMLGPVILTLGLISGRKDRGTTPSLSRLVPWFILGFLAMMVLRSIGLIPDHAVPVLKQASGILTIISMAALGLMVDMRSVFASGGRVLLAGVLSLGVLGSIAFVMLQFLQLPA